MEGVEGEQVVRLTAAGLAVVKEGLLSLATPSCFEPERARSAIIMQHDPQDLCHTQNREEGDREDR